MAQLVFGGQKVKIMRDVCVVAGFPNLKKETFGAHRWPNGQVLYISDSFCFPFESYSCPPLIPFIFLLISFYILAMSF